MTAYILLALFWGIYYSLHTLLASLAFKNKIRSKMGTAYPWYRLLYSLFSAVGLLAILVYGAMIEKRILLANTDFTTYLAYMFAAFGTIIIVKSMKHFSLSSFVGLKPHDDLEERPEFVRKGMHAYVRHPLYAGLLLIFLGFFFFDPVLASLIHLICLIIYLPMGIYFEEKKLIQLYGKSYTQYKKEVPALFPRKFRG
ncbi:methyltransferase family protein [Cecembia calidifontis]|jgi:protein-S-isoprenylcysteine O-methyltransferase Ste14|uniref:Protein-S-isoprenylcysteine O-methyltransferase Ste14 n=1 Tax=Cecembia calidifontis TaxID=1187080 RepID=A0A4Q7P5H1_9BACT|nr:NnrU family protein [Cecembia calidifontis]RZS95283.1 protein-S-isoprenylcysteine O-methyltransferase Ste14 [Cecembia calidifontis]